jgi:hypothetical protein
MEGFGRCEFYDKSRNNNEKERCEKETGNCR